MRCGNATVLPPPTRVLRQLPSDCGPLLLLLLLLLPDGKLEAIGYVAEEGGVTAKVSNVVNMARLFR